MNVGDRGFVFGFVNSGNQQSYMDQVVAIPMLLWERSCYIVNRKFDIALIIRELIRRYIEPMIVTLGGIEFF